MIREIDEALSKLVKAAAGRRTTADVAFDAPTKEWASRRNAPMVNCYLYDIREDLRRRTRGLINEYDDAGTVLARTQPPRYIKLSYLVTAWANRPDDEHRLLSDLLVELIGVEAVPADLLTGSVAGLGLPVPMTVALPPPEDRAFADVWTALGGELRPSLDVVVSAPLAAARSVPAERSAREGLRLGLADTDTGTMDDAVHHQRLPDGGRVSMRRVRRG